MGGGPSAFPGGKNPDLTTIIDLIFMIYTREEAAFLGIGV
jgi:hypothetical protein